MRFWKNAAILCCRQTSDWQAGGDSEPLREQQSDCCRHPQTNIWRCSSFSPRHTHQTADATVLPSLVQFLSPAAGCRP